MKISRRTFVGTAGCAAAGALCTFPSLSLAVAAGDSRSTRGIRCSLLDLKSNCVLPESLDGYRLALGSDHRSLSALDLDSREAHRAIVVPAAGTIDLATSSALSSALNSGATVVWESGAAFLSASEFAAHRAILAGHFEISIGQPAELWTSKTLRRSEAENLGRSGKPKLTGHDAVPYVTYHWPHETRVRDFSRAIPVSASSGRAIAHLGKIPVAWRKPIGNGTFIFLGSPIGPGMRAGDAEAVAWLRAVISESA
ncbi:MAG TPA: hypothetical protein VGJ06_12245 [Candidatus Acidoferrum sp.]|jgi:hypothetical protein